MFYRNMFCNPGVVFDTIEAKMPWLRGTINREFKIQQDGARPHTGTNTVEELQSGGTSMNNVIKAFDEYPADKLEDKWACYILQ